jgi:hypothetical protein
MELKVDLKVGGERLRSQKASKRSKVFNLVKKSAPLW